MTIEEIQAKLTELRALMADKNIRSPEPDLILKSAVFLLALGYSNFEKATGIDCYCFGKDRDIPSAFKEAFQKVNSLPDEKERSALRYRKSLAATLEVARKESIADEFVTPIKNTMDTFTEKALPNYSDNTPTEEYDEIPF